jgi:predicted Zn finger-like uncharacterized protein
MDVRCEKCMTVYEFDDSQVGENGVTVKCTQCGNLFKVKRRSTTAEFALTSGPRSPSWTPPLPSPPQPPKNDRSTQRGVPAIGTSPPKAAPPLPAPTPPAPAASPPPPRPAAAPRVTAPQTPIARATTPSAPAHPSATVQARRTPTPAHPKPSPEEDLALSTTAPMTSPPGGFEGPSAMGDAILPGQEDPAFAPTSPKPRITPPPHMVADTARLGIGSDDLDLPVRSNRAPMMTLAIGLGLIVLVGAGFVLRGKLFGGGDPGNSGPYQQGRNLFLLDTEDAFHQAETLLQEAHGADQKNPLVLAALGELDATWGGYLRDDARDIETKMGAAGEVATRSLRKAAQQHLDDAKKHTGDALALAPDAMEVNRAMAEFLRVDGAPLAEVERYLKRAFDKRPGDAETTYAEGALLFREGRMDEARAKLDQANTLNLGGTQKPLFRALFLLGKLNSLTDKKDDAHRQLQQLVSLNPQHDRARTLLASLDAAPVASPPPVVAAVQPSLPPSAPPVAKKAAADDDEEDVPVAGGDYHKLVQQADRLAENGKGDQARKLYERALGANPRGVEALTGLGYCDLDGERFLTAVDHFKQALNVVPEYGEALIGLAEAYKIRGDKPHAAEFYRRYLKSQPGGAKASMAQKNLRDIEAHLPPPEQPAPAPEEKKVETKIEKSGGEDKPALPKPPPTDEPPP